MKYLTNCLLIFLLHFRCFASECPLEPYDLKQDFLTAMIQNTIGTNLHEVDKGKLYRSAQLTEESLLKVISDQKIKTIINLRGAYLDTDWFKSESKIAQDNSIEMINIFMKGSEFPTKQALVQLLDAYHNAPKPILIHCQLGADRTGLAAAIYGYEFQGQSKSDAHFLNLNPAFYHLLPSTYALDYFFENIYKNENWVRTKYDPCSENYPYFTKSKYCCE